MTCPFLKEAEVKFCRASAHKMLILRAPGGEKDERCSSPDYMTCPSARSQRGMRPNLSECPFLGDSLVQYCAAAAVSKYVPYTESTQLRCGTSAHLYCDAYLSLAEPEVDPSGRAPSGAEPGAAPVEDRESGDFHVGYVRMPKGLVWSTNHMWCDEAEDGTLHIGVDEFLTAAVGRVEAVSYPTPAGLQRPTVVLRVRGADFPMIFPQAIFILGTNKTVKVSPSRLIDDPYRKGWLFEGRTDPLAGPGSHTWDAGLLRGRTAVDWMRAETLRILAFVHEELAADRTTGVASPADGGEVVPGFALALSRESLFKLFSQFFSPYSARGAAQ